ncbi:MAG: hypothetical protein RBJ76_10915 [Stenomitos frigidus ULC029]
MKALCCVTAKRIDRYKKRGELSWGMFIQTPFDTEPSLNFYETIADVYQMNYLSEIHQAARINHLSKFYRSVPFKIIKCIKLLGNNLNGTVFISQDEAAVSVYAMDTVYKLTLNDFTTIDTLQKLQSQYVQERFLIGRQSLVVNEQSLFCPCLFNIYEIEEVVSYNLRSNGSVRVKWKNQDVGGELRGDDWLDFWERYADFILQKKFLLGGYNCNCDRLPQVIADLLDLPADEAAKEYVDEQRQKKWE